MNIISLFSGAGGLDLGFKKAGFTISWANEHDKNIWATHELNFPNTFLCKDSIGDIDAKTIPDCIGIVGGPPCQAFSEAGAKKGTKDPRGQLFWDYVRVLKEKQPKFFVAENVSGLLAQRHKTDLDAFVQAFSDAGYNVDYQLYLANEYNVPQDRLRVVFVGYHKSLNKKFSGLKKSKKIPVLKDVISGMPEPIATKNGKVSTNLPMTNHEYMTGGFSTMFMSRNRIRGWDQPSFTVLATARQVPLHPQAPKMTKVSKDVFVFHQPSIDLYRRLSVRECARIQTFPDDFEFVYNRIEDGYKMVGNAVPVNLALAIAKQIKKDLGL